MNKKQLNILKASKYDGVFAKGAVNGSNVKSEIRDTENGKRHVLTIKFSDYTIVDNDDDLMLQGAFDRSFEHAETSNRKIAFVWQHNVKDPIGRITKFWDDATGAYVEVELSDFDSVPNAKRAWAQVKEGVINQASFGFRYVWESVKYNEPVTDGQGNTIKQGFFAVGQVELYEVSLVTLGCNENTEVVSYSEGEKSLVKNFLSRKDVLNALSALKNQEVNEFLKSYDIEVKDEPRKGLLERLGSI